MLNRIERARKLFDVFGLDAMIVARPENVFYLSGFTGSAGLLAITNQNLYLVTDFRYIEQAAAESPHFEVIRANVGLDDSVCTLFSHRENSVGFEHDYVTYQRYCKLKTNLGNIKLSQAGGLVERLRAVKDDNEISFMHEASQIADKAFKHILSFIRPGITEQEVSFELEWYMRRNGAEDVSFETIVASGERSSMPHGIASDKKINKGDLVTLDFGAIYNRYHSDMTRTIVVGEPDIKQHNIYEIVLKAQQTGLEAVSPGTACDQVDSIVRQIIVEAGYGEYFGHATGHGIGLNIHEEPGVSQRSKTVLQPGMVITVEPGIYLPGWGGVRIEDMLVVRQTGCEILTGSPKDTLMVVE